MCDHVQSEARLAPLAGQTIAISNSCFTGFKRCTVVGIRADQAAAQRTTRLKVTSKHHGLSPNCLVKMITAKRDGGAAAALPALVEAVLQRGCSMQWSQAQQRRVMCNNPLSCTEYVHIGYLRGLYI